MTGTRLTGDDLQDLSSVYFDYSLRALQNSALADLTENPEFTRMLQSYAAHWSNRRMNLPTSDELRESLRSAGLRILSEDTTPRKKRLVERAAIVDLNAIIVARAD